MKHTLIALTSLTVLIAGTALAASSKFSAQVTGVLITNGAGGEGYLDVPIKTANKSDLLVGVSLQSTVLTETKTKGKNGDTNLSTAEGKVDVCLEVDGGEHTDFAPDCVTFEMRKQELETKLSGIVECPTEDDPLVDDFCEVTDDEEIRLLLQTMSANHFNFVVRNLSSGDHVVTARITGSTDTTCETEDETCRAEVAVGPGALTVEEVRATNDGTGIEFN